MKVGDYVRTNDGNIFQITGSDIEFASEIGSDGDLPFNAKIISSEIIDLIEVGDYVNGKKVLDVAIDYIFDYSEEIKIVYFDIDKKDYIYSKVDIKSILTKEQFKSREYRIGE